MSLKVAKATHPDGAPLKTPFLEKNLAPEKLDLVWDNWRSQVAVPTPTSYTESSASNSIVDFSSTDNNSPNSLIPSTTRSSSGRRWGIFGPKKPIADMPTTAATLSFQNEGRQTITSKKSKLLKKQPSKIKSTPNLKGAVLGPVDLGKVNAYYAPVPELRLPKSPAVPQSAHVEIIPFRAREAIVPESDDSAVYFTVDPGWDQSRGEAADVYLLPFPSTFACESPCSLEAPAELRRPRAITQVARTLIRTKETMTHADDETSFLIFE